MPIDAGTITIGCCYVTPKGQVRRVTAFVNGEVRWEARGKKALKGAWPTLGKSKSQKDFANEVNKLVPAHYDPDYA